MAATHSLTALAATGLRRVIRISSVHQNARKPAQLSTSASCGSRRRVLQVGSLAGRAAAAAVEPGKKMRGDVSAVERLARGAARENRASESCRRKLARLDEKVRSERIRKGKPSRRARAEQAVDAVDVVACPRRRVRHGGASLSLSEPLRAACDSNEGAAVRRVARSARSLYGKRLFAVDDMMATADSEGVLLLLELQKEALAPFTVFMRHQSPSMPPPRFLSLPTPLLLCAHSNSVLDADGATRLFASKMLLAESTVAVLLHTHPYSRAGASADASCAAPLSPLSLDRRTADLLQRRAARMLGARLLSRSASS